MKRWLIPFFAAFALIGAAHAAEIQDLSNTDASNTGRFPENMNPSAVNDGARALEGLLSRGLKATIDGCTTSAGGTTAYTLADPRTLGAYYDGLTVCVQWNAANTGAVTLNVDSLGAKAVEWPDGTAISSGELPADGRSILQYDGTQFQIMTMVGAPTAISFTTSSTDTLTNKTIDLGSNTVTGSVAEFNTALQSESFATLAGTETLTNKTISGASNTLSNIAASQLASTTGADTAVATGTAGTASDLAIWNGDGDLVDGPTPPSGTIVGTTDTQTLSAKTLTSPVLNTGVSGTAVLDEDNMSSDSATQLATQQSIKAYVDANGAGFTEETAKTPTAASSVDFGSIPSGTKRITIVFDGLDPSGGSGSDDLEIRIGDSGGVENSGYIGSGVTDSHRACETNSGGVDIFNGSVELRRISAASNRWIFHSICYNEDGGGTTILSSSKATSATLDRVQLLWTSGGNFGVAGLVNIQYE